MNEQNNLRLGERKGHQITCIQVIRSKGLFSISLKCPLFGHANVRFFPLICPLNTLKCPSPECKAWDEGFLVRESRDAQCSVLEQGTLYPLLGTDSLQEMSELDWKVADLDVKPQIKKYKTKNVIPKSYYYIFNWTLQSCFNYKKYQTCKCIMSFDKNIVCFLGAVWSLSILFAI